MKKSVLMVASACVLILQGCSTFHPYTVGVVEPAQNTPACVDWASTTSTCTPTNAAIERAKRVRYEYLRAAGHDELARKLAGSGLTLAASYALLLGVSPGIGPANANDQIMAIGAASAAGYGLTSIFTSPARQKVFVEGAKAVICVQQAATPFDLDRGTLTSVRDILATTGGLSTNIAFVDSYIEEMAFQNTPPTKRVTDYVAGIRREIEAARGAIGRGHAILLESTEVAPLRLSNQIDAISVAVAGQLNATTVDLNSISQIISNLKPAAANIAPQYAPTTPALPNPTVTKAQSALGAKSGFAAAPYFNQLANMRTRTALINSIGDDLERRITAASRTIESCNFAPVELGLRLNTDKITIKQGASSSFLVSEGQAPFVAEFAGTHDGLEVAFVPAFGNRATVTVDKTAKPGEYSISVYDRTLKPVTLTIKVE